MLCDSANCLVERHILGKGLLVGNGAQQKPPSIEGMAVLGRYRREEIEKTELRWRLSAER